MKLGEIGELRSGWGFPNSYQGQKSGDFPFYKVSDMNALSNSTYLTVANNYIDADIAKKLRCKPAPSGTILFPKIGAAIATNKKRILTRESCYDNNVMGIIPDPCRMLSKFLFYIMEGIDLSIFSDNSGALPSIRKSTVEKFSIPVPPLAVQAEIVAILDRFETLVNDLSVGLPAELAARRRQYEYYRDRLLTFQPLEQKP